MSHQPPGQDPGARSGPPPGWYPDPARARALRWWDGLEWSPYTEPLPGTPDESQPGDLGTAAGDAGGFAWFEKACTGRHRRHAASPSGGDQETGRAADPPDPAPVPPPAPGSPEAGLDLQVRQDRDRQPGPVPGSQSAAPGILQRLGKTAAQVALVGAGTLIGITIAVSVAAPPSPPSAGNAAATSSAPAEPGASSAATSTAAGCAGQVTVWRDGGGLGHLTVATGDLRTLSHAVTALGGDLSTGADPAAPVATVQQATASLQSDGQRAQASPPPPCDPGIRATVSAALTDESKAATDCDHTIGEVSRGDTTLAESDLEICSHAVTSANTQTAKAAAAMRASTGT